jgi:uncharacterized DUF497 family protein
MIYDFKRMLIVGILVILVNGCRSGDQNKIIEHDSEMPSIKLKKENREVKTQKQNNKLTKHEKNEEVKHIKSKKDKIKCPKMSKGSVYFNNNVEATETGSTIEEIHVDVEDENVGMAIKNCTNDKINCYEKDGEYYSEQNNDICSCSLIEIEWKDKKNKILLTSHLNLQIEELVHLELCQYNIIQLVTFAKDFPPRMVLLGLDQKKRNAFVYMLVNLNYLGKKGYFCGGVNKCTIDLVDEDNDGVGEILIINGNGDRVVLKEWNTDSDMLMGEVNDDPELMIMAKKNIEKEKDEFYVDIFQ